MSTIDRVLHLLGLAATGVVVTGASGGMAVPAWLMITASVVTFVTGTAAGSALPKAKKPEDPK